MNLRLALTFALLATPLFAADAALRDLVAKKVAADYPSLEKFYIDLHSSPELSLMEEKTAAKLAAELRAAGFEVTEKFGGHGVVAVLKNGAGPTVLVRADLDGLPVQEETGVPYASTVRTKNLAGQEVPVMHACGHDLHMACLVGTARVLAASRVHWSGTVVLIGQPAEEIVVGARAMLAEGLYTKFPKPDFALALHDSATLPAGVIGTTEGPVMASSTSIDLTVRGLGGHGAAPQSTKDPIVLASRIVLALQTIVSRELRPLDPAVVTVGSIHGGTKHNIIPDEVKLQLTVRAYSDPVRDHILEAIKRICRGEAIATGLPEDRMPIIEVRNEGITSTINDPALTKRVHAAIADWLGANAVRTIDPDMVSEDFSLFGRTAERVPICLFRLGAADPAKVAESQRTGTPLPSLHSSKFAPLPEPTIKTGITAMGAAVLDLLTKK